MNVQVETIGCDKQYGTRRVILDDDQLGELAVYEMEVDTIDELLDVLDSVDTLKIESSPWDEFDARVTVVCGNL
jgi:hypothetical protein